MVYLITKYKLQRFFFSIFIHLFSFYYIPLDIGRREKKNVSTFRANITKMLYIIAAHVNGFDNNTVYNI